MNIARKDPIPLKFNHPYRHLNTITCTGTPVLTVKTFSLINQVVPSTALDIPINLNDFEESHQSVCYTTDYDVKL